MTSIEPLTGGPSVHRRRFLRLTAPLAPLLAVAAALGVGWDGLYRDNPFVVAQAVGQDWVTLLFAVPALLIARARARRGSLVGHLVALGVVGYAAYSYAIYAFASRQNELFLVYVAILGLSVYALIDGVLAIERREVEALGRAPIARRAIAALLGGAAVFFAIAWISEQVAALVRGEVPASVVAFGGPTNPVHVLDLAFVLPLCALAAALLWRARAIGAVLGIVLLFKIDTLALALLSMGAFLWMRGQPVDAGLLIAFGALALLALAASAQVLRALQGSRALPRSA